MSRLSLTEILKWYRDYLLWIQGHRPTEKRFILCRCCDLRGLWRAYGKKKPQKSVEKPMPIICVQLIKKIRHANHIEFRQISWKRWCWSFCRRILIISLTLKRILSFIGNVPFQQLDMKKLEERREKKAGRG